MIGQIRVVSTQSQKDPTKCLHGGVGMLWHSINIGILTAVTRVGVEGFGVLKINRLVV